MQQITYKVQITRRIKLIFLFLVLSSYSNVFADVEILKSTELHYSLGKEYTILNPSLPLKRHDRIEIKLLFWYGCLHCQQLDKMINEWQKESPEILAIEKIPVVFNTEGATLARIYYTLKALNLEEKSNDIMFITVQKNKPNFNDLKAVTIFFQKHFDVAPENFLKIYNSFDVSKKAQRAAHVTRIAQLRSVPSLVIQGKFRVNFDKLPSLDVGLKVSDYLIAKNKQLMNPELLTTEK